MNIFKAIGTILESVTNMVVELCRAGETTARTINETAGIAEDAVKTLRAEQAAELRALQSDTDTKD